MGKGKCVFLNLTKGVSSDKSKNLTKAIGKKLEMKNQSAEYLNGLLKIGKWNYQVSINADYKVSYSFLDRVINKIVDVKGIKKVFGVSTTNNSIGSFIYLIVEGKNVTRRKLENPLQLKKNILENVNKIKSRKEFYHLVRHLGKDYSYHNIAVKKS